jgi:hypothetical protein
MCPSFIFFYVVVAAEDMTGSHEFIIRSFCLKEKGNLGPLKKQLKLV